MGARFRWRAGLVSCWPISAWSVSRWPGVQLARCLVGPTSAWSGALRPGCLQGLFVFACRRARVSRIPESGYALPVNGVLARVTGAFSGLVDLVLPLRCGGCGSPGAAWCPACARELGRIRRVDRPLLGPRLPVFALGRYSGPARHGILAYKESGRRDLAEPFGQHLATGLRALAADGRLTLELPCSLVPVPSRSVAARRRAGAHMPRIASHAVAELSAAAWQVSVVDCLALRRGVVDSAGLAAEERIRNLAGRVRLRAGRTPPRDRPLVLVDDVITTAATAASCVAALDSAGLDIAGVVGMTATAG